MIKERKGDIALRVCDKCGNEQWVSYWNLKKKNMHLCRYCNNNKIAKSRIGTPSPLKGIKKIPKKVGSYYICYNGYVHVWIGKHTDKVAGGYYRENRLQAELKLGRRLKDKEIVHHIDGNKINNVPNNLHICSGHRHHKHLHSQLERISFELVKANAIQFDHEKGQYYIGPQLSNWLSKSGELLETPEKGNQQRSFINMTDEERSTTIHKWSTLK